MSGHKTDAIYKRYNIIDEEDMKESMVKAQGYLKNQSRQSKVSPIRAANRGLGQFSGNMAFSRAFD